MSKIKYYIMDVETTGFSPVQNEIIELTIIRAEDKARLTKIVKAENPKTANYGSLKITGRTYADLKNGDKRADVVKRISSFLEEDNLSPEHRCFICHNAKFDRQFIHAMFEAEKMTFPANLWLCTMNMSKSFGKKIGITKPKVGLKDAIAMLESKRVGGEHNSSDDAKNTYFLWQKLINEGIEPVDHIKRIQHYID